MFMWCKQAGSLPGEHFLRWRPPTPPTLFVSVFYFLRTRTHADSLRRAHKQTVKWFPHSLVLYILPELLNYNFRIYSQIAFFNKPPLPKHASLCQGLQRWSGRAESEETLFLIFLSTSVFLYCTWGNAEYREYARTHTHTQPKTHTYFAGTTSICKKWFELCYLHKTSSS